MVRPRRLRKVCFCPSVNYFKPAGVPMQTLAETVLSTEELEAVRLIDFEEKSQDEVSKKMNVSQPTFSRILKSARKKISDALVNGKAIKVSGGNFEMVED